MSGKAQPPAPAAARRKMLGTFEEQAPSPPPIWLMRQAGRYLPEYRRVRQQAGSFLDLCYNPELAAEVTLQPIRRYGFDAAILFSDILVVPHALGQGLRFVVGEGPRLDPIRSAADLGLLTVSGPAAAANLAPVYETVSRLRAALPSETTLIGFCGAPWTVATYMVAGRGTPDQADARLWAYRDPGGFQTLIDRLVETSIAYLCGQASAGADVLQIFDTWAGNLPLDQFRSWVESPTRAIVEGVRERFPKLPIIGFPRGAGTRLGSYVAATGVDGVGVDTSLPMRDAIAQVGSRTVVQGNLDPLLLVAGGAPMDAAVRDILSATRGRPFVFNLGHGIVPETPPEHVARLVQVIRGGGA